MRGASGVEFPLLHFVDVDSTIIPTGRGVAQWVCDLMSNPNSLFSLLKLHVRHRRIHR